MFPHKVEPEGEWMIEVGREVAATGGILFHYNVPYGDIYSGGCRALAGGAATEATSFKMLKRTCYEMGKCPRGTLQCVNHRLAWQPCPD